MNYFSQNMGSLIGLAQQRNERDGEQHKLGMEQQRANWSVNKQSLERQAALSDMDFKDDVENRATEKFNNQYKFRDSMEDLGKSRQLREWASHGGGRGMRRSYADGGLVQDVQAKGFVPVQVSNGEFEFTPEQVANIGAAMLASQE